MSATTTNRVGVWYPTESVRQAFAPLNQFYPTFIKRQYAAGNMTREQSIEAHSIFLLAQEVTVALCESGVSAAELMEWLSNKEEIRSGAVRDVITKQNPIQ